jgi:sigma-B regulation protein RsbU (phosphoserine phosphatase)
MIAVALAIARSISRPIRALDDAAQTLAGGDLEATLPVARGGDEVAHLTRSFGNMQRDLRRHIKDLADVTAAKARIESDLATARRIQLDLLPSRFDFDPPRPAVDIRAILEPAKAVGGDFYDFFFIDPRRLFVAVGDVSGKGVPASLFMAVSKAYLKAFVKQGHSPAEALAHLNDELAIENDEGLFLTAFCASVDVETGACAYASGGHAPPLLVRAAGAVEIVPAVQGPLIGLDGGRSFAAGDLELAPGDLLFVSSDGVAEAENSEQALYGDERLARVLARLRGASAEAVLAGVWADIQTFVAGAPPSDDITMLALRLKALG